MNAKPCAHFALALSLLAGAALVVAPAQAATYVYSCVLSGKQEGAASTAVGQGGGRFVIDTNAKTVSYWISYANLSSAETAAHIHGYGGPTVPAGVLVGLPAGNPKLGVWNYNPADEAPLLAGQCYVNIHTAINGGGEIRGQIVPLNAVVDAAQETPPTASTGSGWMTATIDTTANTISYYLAYSGLTGAVTAAHFHGNVNYGTPAGVKVGLAVTASPMTGTVGYSQADEPAILTGQFYVNLHTAANGGGEIRGQLSPIVVPMDWVQEGGSVTTTASAGYALTAIDVPNHTLGYDVHVLALSGPEILAHIHGYADLGSNAGVLQTLPGGARKIGTWVYPTANAVDVFTGRTYFNSHTSLNPGGEIRGQIMFLPGGQAVLGVGDQPHVATGLAAAPNPFGRGTSLSFQLARTGTVSLAIMSVDGRLVRRVPPATFAPGPHSFQWDGLDDAGQAVAPGVYFAVVHTPDGDKTTRLARLR